MKEHRCVMSERILTLELNMKNFMQRVEEKFDTIISKLDDMPNVYATKSELSVIQEEIKTQRWDKRQWVQTRWAIIVAIISWVAYMFSAYFNK